MPSGICIHDGTLTKAFSIIKVEGNRAVPKENLDAFPRTAAWRESQHELDLNNSYRVCQRTYKLPLLSRKRTPFLNIKAIEEDIKKGSINVLLLVWVKPSATNICYEMCATLS